MYQKQNGDSRLKKKKIQKSKSDRQNATGKGEGRKGKQ